MNRIVVEESDECYDIVVFRNENDAGKLISRRSKIGKFWRVLNDAVYWAQTLDCDVSITKRAGHNERFDRQARELYK